MPRLEIVVDGNRRLAEEVIVEVQSLAKRYGLALPDPTVVAQPASRPKGKKRGGGKPKASKAKSAKAKARSTKTKRAKTTRKKAGKTTARKAGSKAKARRRR